MKRFGYGMAEGLGRLKTLIELHVSQLGSHQFLRGCLGGFETGYRRLST
jgi:hypothetical protein